MKKRIDNWLKKHLVGVSLAWLAFLLLVDTYYVVRYISGLFIVVDYVFSVIYMLLTVFYLVFMPIIVRRKRLEKATEMILEESKKYYFHGFKLYRYVGTFAFWRLQRWLGSGRCYALSILAMIMLKCNNRATLYRGDCYDKDGNFKTRHSWVEFKIPLNGWWVVDFSWIRECFAYRKAFFKAVNADGGKLEVKWRCTYDKFWNTPFVGAICEAMQAQETSNVYKMLGAFGNPEDKEYGFTKYCYSKEMLQGVAQKYMIPYYDYNGNPISSRIIRDFVKNPKRKQPKARSIRLTRLVIHRYKKWRAKQAQPITST